MGKCPECGTWNSLREIKTPTFAMKASTQRFASADRSSEGLEPKRLSEIKFEEKNRFGTGFSEMDGVLGGGIVPGSVILLAGDPGIGKSTLLLQLALNIASQGGSVKGKGESKSSRLTLNPSPYKEPSVLYISGEESEQQIKLRANRLTKSKNSDLLLLSLTNT